MLWFWLSLLSAFSLALADAVSKKGLGDYRARELVVVRFVFAGMVCLPLLLWQSWPSPEPAFWGWVAGLVPLELVAMLLYMRAIRNGALAHTLPYLAFTPVLTIVTGYVLLGERVSMAGATGILLVMLGAWWLNIEHKQGESLMAWLAPFRAIVREPGSRDMLLVATLYSFTAVLGKGALGYVSPDFFGSFYYVLIGLATLLLMPLAKVGFAVLWQRPAWHLAIGFLMAVMVVSHFAAIEQVEVAYMISVKRTSLLFGIGLGALMLGERDLGRNLMAGSLMVVGVVVIALYG